MRKFISIFALALLVFSASAFQGGCSANNSPSTSSISQSEGAAISKNTQRLRQKYPIPQLQDSNELKNLSDRATFLNKSESIGYIYLLSYGNVMAFYTVRGKVTSLNAYMTATQSIVDDPHGSLDAGSLLVETADVDGAYGENDHGIFFFTTEGVYVEWKGEYLFSNQPLKLNQPVQLSQQVK